MKIVIAMDSFKGSMSSLEAGCAAKEGICRVYPDVEVDIIPVADGGEGTVEALVTGIGGEIQRVNVTGPLGLPVTCQYGILHQDGTAVIEIAGAAGLTLVPEHQRNPLYTTTYGVGEAIKDAVCRGCRRFIIGIGGSATNDGGVGMLQALGFSFLNGYGEEIPWGTEGLKDLTAISAEGALRELSQCEFRIACDVINPLCGENGCSRVFAPQKGATEKMAEQMDGWMAHYAKLTKAYFENACNEAEKCGEACLSQYVKTYGEDDKVYIPAEEYPGSGAAGGLGFAFLVFLQGKLEPGIRIVMEETGLADRIKDADIVLTGEGFLDAQTIMGKAPAGIAALAKQYGKKVAAFAGGIAEDLDLSETDFDAAFSIMKQGMPLEEAMRPECAKGSMADAVERAARTCPLFERV